MHLTIINYFNPAVQTKVTRKPTVIQRDVFALLINSFSRNPYLRTDARTAARPKMTSNIAHQTPHAHLFDSTFWQILPAHYDKINSHWKLIATLYHEASAAIMATDRAAGVNSLKAELEMLEQDIARYREVVKSVALEDIVGIYVVAGRQRWRAEEIAEEDLLDIERSLTQLETKAKELKADIVYGFEEK